VAVAGEMALTIPHFIVLFLLWIAVFLVTVVAFVTVLITGSPAGWSW
jgi:hypothetical protein